ncbi:hypothetical protein B14911_01244 [Bacillus sp. NRRL B-14911]|uniref:Uncharacterized protein n=1 Tax=Bacillus infantis NRRL B-14911 TaxID=1367477 RepID=U5L470_9BACI|nr:hypothetical protein N288_00890 [Bacillus infantis NRRL B-14911]EAR64075.1 hypothetical protein B14911_01244 [Bacillus sp. NRRL B-14911]
MELALRGPRFRRSGILLIVTLLFGLNIRLMKKMEDKPFTEKGQRTSS